MGIRTIPFTVVGVREERTLIVPGLAMRVWLAADRRLRDLGRDEDADKLKAELRLATFDIVKKYVTVKGMGVAYEGGRGEEEWPLMQVEGH